MGRASQLTHPVAFKQNHPEVYTVADVGMIIGGPILREIMTVAYTVRDLFSAFRRLTASSYSLSALPVLPSSVFPSPSTQ
jgi:hypothetical protein